MSKITAFSLSLSRGIAYATSECQMEVRENAVSKYDIPFMISSTPFMSALYSTSRLSSFTYIRTRIIRHWI